MTKQKYSKLLKAVVFIYQIPENIDPHEAILWPHGTGFLLSYPVIENTAVDGFGRGMSFYWVVTNKHVLHTHDDPNYKDKITLRLNDTNDQGFFHEIRLDYNGPNRNVILHPNDAVDLAAIYLSQIDNFLPIGLAYQLIAGQKEFTEVIQIGSRVCLTGYAAGYAGHQKNYPAVRFGQVALTSEEQWYWPRRVSSPSGTRESAFLIESGASGGSSGSPVLFDGTYKGNDDPLIVGVAKGSQRDHDGLPQGLLAVEPAIELLELADIVFQTQQKRTSSKLMNRANVPD